MLMRIAPRVGLDVGLTVKSDQGGAAWSTDLTSTKGVPTAAEWNALIASSAGLSAWSIPNGVYLCQDATSPLDDAAGAIDLALAGTGASYQQTITGWSRKAVTLTDNAVTAGWGSSDASLPDISTTSQLLLAYVRMPPSAPSAARQLICLGTGGQATIRILATTGFLQVVSFATGVSGSINAAGAGVVPLILKVNQTTNQVIAYTNTAKIGPAFSASMTGKGVVLGAGAGNSASAGYLYAARWDGVAAERSDQEVKNLLTALGWTVTGY